VILLCFGDDGGGAERERKEGRERERWMEKVLVFIILLRGWDGKTESYI